jgi:hypothetical protein
MSFSVGSPLTKFTGSILIKCLIFHNRWLFSGIFLTMATAPRSKRQKSRSSLFSQNGTPLSFLIRLTLKSFDGSAVSCSTSGFAWLKKRFLLFSHFCEGVSRKKLPRVVSYPLFDLLHVLLPIQRLLVVLRPKSSRISSWNQQRNIDNFP